MHQSFEHYGAIIVLLQLHLLYLGNGKVMGDNGQDGVVFIKFVITMPHSICRSKPMPFIFFFARKSWKSFHLFILWKENKDESGHEATFASAHGRKTFSVFCVLQALLPVLQSSFAYGHPSEIA